MSHRNRREFLADVGKGMLVASVGPALAFELGLASASAAEGADRLTFGDREPLVGLMQDTPANQLLPILADKLKAGTKLEDLVAAGALANARTFGGENYDGYHAFMALLPSYQMSRELRAERQALPVLKVLYRNTSFIQNEGGKREVLHPIAAGDLPKDHAASEDLCEAARKRDVNASERIFAAMAKGTIADAYNSMLPTVQEEVDVHRTVLAWRAWATLDLVGKENAHTLLRQSVRFCIHEGGKSGSSEISALLPKLLDQYKLVGRPLGAKVADDAWLLHLADTIYRSNRAQGAEAVAAALAEGFAPDVIGEAMSLAATKLVLCMPGRTGTQIQPGKPEGSIHGAGVGVHGVVGVLRAREDAKGFVTMDARPAFAPGDKVRVLAGAFMDNAGLFNGMADHDRVSILLDMLGRKVRVLLDADLVAAA